MFQSRKKKSFWSQLFDTEREDRFTIKELGFLHDVLDSNAKVHEGNKDTVVEALRSIAELMIWGDQHDPSFFDFFAEHQTLSYFRRILSQGYCRSGEVAVQILQTLSILTQNIQSEQAIYFLFSNNHVNRIIMQDFNFKDDEVLGYYISFLKTISLKLNAGTVQFFFLKRKKERNAEGNSSGDFHMEFPFYSRIIQFFRHEESMVRAAVRTCTLNIYSVKDAGVRDFLQNSREANAYIANLGKYVVEQCQALSVILPATKQGTIDPKRLDVALEELDDIFYYCYDIYSLFEDGVGEQLMCVVWKDLHRVVLEPFRTQSDGGDANASQEEDNALDSCRLTVSLLILERLFHILHIPGLLDAVFASLFLPKAKALKLAPLVCTTSEEGCGQTGKDDWYSTWPVFRRCIAEEGTHIESTLIARFLTKCIKSKHLNEDVMDAAGLLPSKVKTSRMLFNELTSIDSDVGSGTTESTEAESDKERTPRKKGHRRLNSSEELAHLQLFPQDAESSRTDEAGEEDSDVTALAERLEGLGEEGRPGGAEAGKQDDAPYLILAGLISEPFRVDLVNLVGWMLFQWLPMERSLENKGDKMPDDKDREAVLSPRAGALCGRSIPEVLSLVLDEQMKRCVSQLRVHLQQSWCDGLPLLISRAWQQNKRHLMSPHVSMNAVETAAFLLHDQSNAGNKGRVQTSSHSPGMNTAVSAAKQGNEAVNAFVAMAQLKLWIQTGDLPNDPSVVFGIEKGLFSLDEPVGLVPHDRRPLPISDGSEVDISSMNLVGPNKGGEKEEGSSFVTGALPCRVAFTRGAERKVFFCSDGRHALSSRQKNGQRELGSVCIFLADVNESSGTSGSGRFAKIVAMAPLAGAEPAIDPTHPAWLHLRVRPPLSAFMAVCSMMNASQSFGQQGIKGKKPKLNDGRWTLAFEDAESAKKAAEMVHSQRKRLRGNSEQLLEDFIV